MMENCKKDFIRFVSTLLAVFTCVGAAGIILDPFYQYHRPWLGMPVILENAVYQTPGAARNLEYSDAIIGTSMTENFHTRWFDEELGWDTIKLSYSGARSNDLNAVLTAVFSRKEPVRHIFMDMNDYQLTSASWTAYVERPKYLYDECLFNDYLYIYNRDVMAEGWKRVLDALQGRGDNIDAAYTWEDEALFGKETALNTVRDTIQQLRAGQPDHVPLEQRLVVCQENLDNILPFIEQNPNTEFIIFFPPYSMLYWEETVLKGELEEILAIYRYAMGELLKYDNVSIYYFQQEEEIITDLENYRDACHHRPEYNRYIFDCIKENKNQVTADNLDRTIQEMFEFAFHYNYDSHWE